MLYGSNTSGRLSCDCRWLYTLRTNHVLILRMKHLLRAPLPALTIQRFLCMFLGEVSSCKHLHGSCSFLCALVFFLVQCRRETFGTLTLWLQITPRMILIHDDEFATPPLRLRIFDPCRHSRFGIEPCRENGLYEDHRSRLDEPKGAMEWNPNPNPNPVPKLLTRARRVALSLIKVILLLMKVGS